VTPAERIALLVLTALALALSCAISADRFTWFLEVVPVLLGAPLLLASARRFPLTPLLYRLLFLHALVLMVGGAYTYAKVPLGFWLQDLLHLERNPYDRIGHLMQGFVPAILAREILLRTSPLRPGRWLFVLVTCVCLAFSAFYELIEWRVAVATGAASDAFLGTQGDPWDTQWDMCCALIGALAAQLLLARIHDRQVDALPVGVAPGTTGPHSPAR
jgi:putative membrane protein